jgi:hypothetical protein
MHKSKCKASQRRLRRPWVLSLRRKQRIKAAEQIQGKRYRHAAGAFVAAITLCKDAGSVCCYGRMDIEAKQPSLRAQIKLLALGYFLLGQGGKAELI